MRLRWFTADDLAAYRTAGDPLMAHLRDPRAAGLTSERWLLESEPRRMVAWALYGPLLAMPRTRVVDVGAGYSSLSYLLAERHDYLAVDLGAHGAAPEGVPALAADWADSEFGADLVVSMDLLPNVDQRLDAFLRRFRSTPLRLVLTTYEGRSYRTRRIDADEILTFVPWTWAQTVAVLRDNGIHVPSGRPEDDLFGNGRSVCLLRS